MKKIIVGLVAGLFIGTAGMAAAAAAQTVQAALAKFSFSVNGQKQMLKNDPLVYKGNTYLPVRELSDLLGYELKFDPEEKSIDLLEKNKQLPAAVAPIPTPVAAPTSTPGTVINLEEWKPVKELIQSKGLGFMITKENCGLWNTSGNKVLTFNFDSTFEYSKSAPVVFQTKEKSASILVYQDTYYAGKDTLRLLGVAAP